MLCVGNKVNIKPEAWKRFCKENGIDANHPLPPPQVITDMPAHSPFGDKFMLSFPFYWWNENDLLLVEDEVSDYEKVESIIINGVNLAIGDRISCICVYQVIELQPVWHSETKKHLVNLNNNSVKFRMIETDNCLIHSNRKIL